MKSPFCLAAIAASLIVLAEPREVVRGLPDPSLPAQSGIDPSTISIECQPQCTSIINTLDACNSVASCECTQANYDDLGTCLNCLQALAPKYVGNAPGGVYAFDFQSVCTGFGLVLNHISITAKPTGIASTGDPFSVFSAVTPTSGKGSGIAQATPLIPTLSVSSGNKGGAVGFSALRSLDAAAVGAVSVVAILMGGLLL